MFNKVFGVILVVFLWVCIPFAHAQSSADREDPCPEANTALSQTPDDLSTVQADIDRFTLCVERAQLLRRLNDLATENEESLLGLSPQNPGFSLGGDPVLDTLPTFDREAVLNPNANAAPVPDPGRVDIDQDGWVILSVFGAGQNLSAKIAKSDGTLAQVKAGDLLPDGARVKSVSSTAVVLNVEGSEQSLDWLESDQ